MRWSRFMRFSSRSAVAGDLSRSSRTTWVLGSGPYWDSHLITYCSSVKSMASLLMRFLSGMRFSCRNAHELVSGSKIAGICAQLAQCAYGLFCVFRCRMDNILSMRLLHKGSDYQHPAVPTLVVAGGEGQITLGAGNGLQAGFFQQRGAEVLHLGGIAQVCVGVHR